jgi:hypothetical protein
MRRTMGVLAAVGLMASLAACGGGSGATPAPTVTVAPTAAAEATPGSDAEPFDLTLLGNSGGFGVAKPYAALAAEALGREVRVHDYSVGGEGPNELLSMVQGLGADVAGAEIIVVIVSPIGVTPASHMACIPFYGDLTGEPPVATSVEDWQDLRDALDQVYDEIWRLRAGQPTIIRTVGSAPWLAQTRQAGIESECMANEEVREQVERSAAEAAGAVFVSWMDLFNGPAHDVDPVEQGSIADGVHLNDAGRAVLVEALAATGWEASEPPG